MDQIRLYIEKSSDLMRSVFVTFGLAQLLYETAGTSSNVDVRIQDMGGAYSVETTEITIDELKEQIALSGLPPLLPAIFKEDKEKNKKKEKNYYVPNDFNGIVIDYAKEKEKNKTTPSNSEQERTEDSTSERATDFPLWEYLCSNFGKGSAMRKGYPLVLHIWHAHQGKIAQDLFELILSCYSEFPPNIEKAREDWLRNIKSKLNYPQFKLFDWNGSTEADISALSVVSPTTTKGSYTDSGARQINNDTPVIFWLEMYLAFAGFMQVAMPFRCSGKDLVLYYPLPRKIRYTLATDLIRKEYRKHVRSLYNWSYKLPRAKLDILAEIDFYISLVKHFRENLPGKRRIDVFDGLVGYYYKEISTHTPFDDTTFALPRWLDPEADEKELKSAKEILDAHKSLIESIPGNFGEELIILNDYRRFATLGDPNEWIMFAIHYGNYYLANLIDNHYLTILKFSIFERTLVDMYKDQQTHKDYRPIIENRGFLNIARAINACTTRLHYFKEVKKNTTAFNVRYGLGDDLRRRAHDADLFIEDLSEFIHSYMQESSRVQANTGEERPFITDDDLYAVIRLVQEYGSRVVSNLLVAVGYASHYDPDKAKTPTESQSQ